MIIDTHCHYNLGELYADWQQHWKTAQQHQVVGTVVVGTSLDSSHTALSQATQEKGFYASVGIHPTDEKLATLTTSDWETLRSISRSDKCIAIGECGLDYYRLPRNEVFEEVKAQQQQVLIQQLTIAKELNVPLIIHLRDQEEAAYWDFLKIYTQEGPFSKPFILHCVSGPVAFVTKCLSLGAYIGVAGNVTYKNSAQIHEIIKATPVHRILSETDAPFLPPHPHRGNICEPWMIQLTIDYLFEHFSISAEQLLENAKSIFPQFRE